LSFICSTPFQESYHAYENCFLHLLRLLGL